MFLDAEGVGEDGRAIGEAAQHAVACGIVEVLLLVGGACVPLRQVIQQVVGEGAGGVVGRAAGDVAKAVVAARTEYILKQVYIRCLYDYISYPYL